MCNVRFHLSQRQATLTQLVDLRYCEPVTARHRRMPRDWHSWEVLGKFCWSPMDGCEGLVVDQADFVVTAEWPDRVAAAATAVGRAATAPPAARGGQHLQEEQGARRNARGGDDVSESSPSQAPTPEAEEVGDEQPGLEAAEGETAGEGEPAREPGPDAGSGERRAGGVQVDVEGEVQRSEPPARVWWVD